MNVGKNIKIRRKQLGMSAEELADKIGCSPTTIYRYENGMINNVNTEKLVPIAKALITTPERLMGWGEEPSPKDVQISYLDGGRALNELISNISKLNDTGLMVLAGQVEALLKVREFRKHK